MDVWKTRWGSKVNILLHSLTGRGLKSFLCGAGAQTVMSSCLFIWWHSVLAAFSVVFFGFFILQYVSFWCRCKRHSRHSSITLVLCLMVSSCFLSNVWPTLKQEVRSYKHRNISTPKIWKTPDMYPGILLIICYQRCTLKWFCFLSSFSKSRLSNSVLLFK